MRLRVLVCIFLFWTTGELLGAIRAGAARIEITPPKDARLAIAGYEESSQIYEGIHDPLYVRALVVDDGRERAAIVTCEILYITNEMWEATSRRVSEQVGIRPQNLMLTAVHTHGAPKLDSNVDGKPVLTAYVGTVEDAAVEAIRQASGKLKPARTGFGVGKANLNINRRARFADGGYWLGFNPEGPSDKSVGVFAVEDYSSRPIAVLINYAVHGVMMGWRNHQITADLPGATSRFVEQQLGDPAVALWTSGAAGDQNPIWNDLDTDYDPVAAFGRILGEEVVKVLRSIRTSERGSIRTTQRVVTCPGQQVAPGPLPRAHYEFGDADPVHIRLSLLMIGHTTLAGVSGEVLTRIGQRLKNESPFAHTLMLTLCNGYSGYLPDDDAYQQISYEIATSHVKRGCAEGAIVDGLTDMMDQE